MDQITLPKKYIRLGLCLLLAIGCSRREPAIPAEQILAKVGDEVILADEFIRRAEYTIRPPYCHGDSYIHKKIVLNSLIAEKLVALETGSDNELARNTEFLKYIQGRQEQAMRQYYFYDLAYQKVELDTAELKKVYNLAARTYQVKYIRLPNVETASLAWHLYQTGEAGFEAIAAKALDGAEIPRREIGFNSDLNDEMFNIFFTEPLLKDQVLEPVRLEDGSVLMMKVDGWIREVTLSDTGIRDRMNQVREKLTAIQANQIYSDLVAGIMKGKTLELDPRTFPELTRIIGPQYLKSMQEKENAFNQQFWGGTNEVLIDSISGTEIDRLRKKPLFTLNGEIWTVAQFEDLVASHPLVFRKKKISQKEFPEQFKFAIADLVRDYFITRQAYQAGYQDNSYVKNYTAMWRDSMLSIFGRNQYLAGINYSGDFPKEYLAVVNQYLNPWIDSLQSKYADKIEINTDLFETIKLTDIDLFVVQNKAPYPIVTPGFPILTSDNKLDYGKKLEIQ